MRTYFAYRLLLLLVLAMPVRAQLTAASETQFRQASDGFSSIIKASPTFAEAYLNLGLVREEQGRHPEAIDDFQKALQLKPRLRGATLFIGVAQFRSNQMDSA